MAQSGIIYLRMRADLEGQCTSDAGQVLGSSRQISGTDLNWMGLRLAKYYGISARFWMERQLNHALGMVLVRAHEIQVQAILKRSQ